MNSDSNDSAAPASGVTATPNGPFVVTGSVPLYRRRSVQSEHGEPLVWETTERVETREKYYLCRCGQSVKKPFCDGAHTAAEFHAEDGDSGSYEDRSNVLGGTGITVSDDRSICVHAGFCGTRVANVWGQVPETGESTVRQQVISMVSNCPSGALTFRFDGDDVEPLLAEAISVTEDGPLWLTGSIPVAIDGGGTTLEVRNRVTLCRCGASANKPLCDGSHKAAGFQDPSK